MKTRWKYKNILLACGFILLFLFISFISYKTGYKKGTAEVVKIFPAEEKVVSPTPQISSAILSISPTPLANVHTLSSTLPSGWTTFSSANKVFSVGFDPQILKASTEGDNQINLQYTSGYGGLAYTISVQPYDGGSRHQFIYKYTFSGPYMIIDKTYERNYIVNGKSGLVMYNVDASATNVVGMMNIDGSRAFFITGSSSDQKLTEQILSNIRINP